MNLDHRQIEHIKSLNPIEEVIGTEVTLRRSGQSFVGDCPFCTGSKPKLTVTPAKQMWFCFRCETGGDVVKWIMLRQSLSFREALDVLAQRAGIAV